MCGIAGCVGHHEALNFVLDGLGQMDERGYDSAGIAYPGMATPKLDVIRAVGPVEKLKAQIPVEAALATTAIGHTRWATHGSVSIENAHPQINTDGSIAVVHNGIIENHEELQEELEALGYVFRSGTDTEVVPHLLDHHLQAGAEPDEAFNKMIRRLEGAYAILASFGIEPDTIYAARKGGPLLMGVRGKERFVASMRSVIRPHTRWIDPLKNYEMARLSADERKYRTWSFDGRITTRKPEKDNGKIESASKGNFEHWMLKEIYEGPETAREAMKGRVYPEKGLIRLGGLEDPEIQERLKVTDRIAIVACGTSYYAGLIGERIIEEVAGLPVEVHLASEFQYRNEPLGRHTAVLGISQSGETADTIGALHKAKDLGLLTLGINNSGGSEMEEITDAGVHCHAGRERSVASTKAFVSQVIVLAEMALALSNESSTLRQPLMDELLVLPDKMERVLDIAAEIQILAKKYTGYNDFLFLGRGYEHVSAMEGALKLKEISYTHAEAYAGGEMKHGPIALIDENFPTFAIATDSPVYEKMVSNVQEIKARGGPVIAIATEGNEAIKELVDDVIFVPASLEQTQPILNVMVMQLFAYYAALEKGLDIDRPRNLAKSVTVE